MSKQWFHWKAVDGQGTIKSGRWPAENLSEVLGRLRDEGYLPVTVRKTDSRFKHFIPLGSRVQWSFLAGRLASLLEAGIPLLQALEIMTTAWLGSAAGQRQWEGVKSSVLAGKDLAEALQSLRPAPPTYVLAMVKAGEHSGNLGKVLQETAAELEREEEFRQRLRTALAYPIFLLTAVLIVLVVLSTSILPMYESLFASMSVPLPWLTRVIFGVGQKLPAALAAFGAVVLASLIVARLSAPNVWRKRFSAGISALPLVGRIYRLRDLVNFTQISGHLLSTGIPLLDSLRLTVGVQKTPGMAELTERLIRDLRQGKRLAGVLYASRIFPREAAEMLAVAEESGQLDKMFINVARLYRQELEYQLERLTQLLGPVLTLIMAGLIGLTAGGIMLPMFDLSSHLE